MGFSPGVILLPKALTLTLNNDGFVLVKQRVFDAG